MTSNQNLDSRWLRKYTIHPDGAENARKNEHFSANFQIPKMLMGNVLRNPHLHPNIKTINTKKAKLVPGVKSAIPRNVMVHSPFDKPMMYGL